MPFLLFHINEDPSGGSAEKEEVDSRSIYVGNVRLPPPLIFSTCFSFVFVYFSKKVLFILFWYQS